MKTAITTKIRIRKTFLEAINPDRYKQYFVKAIIDGDMTYCSYYGNHAPKKRVFLKYYYLIYYSCEKNCYGLIASEL